MSKLDTVLLYKNRYTKQIQKTIDLPLRTWVIYASGLLLPGDALKVWLNVEISDEDETEKRTFVIACHDGEQIDNIDNLMHIATFDVEDESYSVFEVLKIN